MLIYNEGDDDYVGMSHKAGLTRNGPGADAQKGLFSRNSRSAKMHLPRLSLGRQPNRTTSFLML